MKKINNAIPTFLQTELPELMLLVNLEPEVLTLFIKDRKFVDILSRISLLFACVLISSVMERSVVNLLASKLNWASF